jgi:hypothetical protein
MGRSLAPPTVADPQAILKHNVRVWRRNGYSDDYIARALIRPPVCTKEGYQALGLKWPNRRPGRQPSQTKMTPGRCIEIIHEALASPEITYHDTLISRLRVGKETLQKLRNNHPDVEMAYQRLVQKNRVIGQRNRKQNERARADIDKIEAMFNHAASEGRVVAVRDLCKAVGRSPAWLRTRAVNQGDERAHQLNEKIKKYNSKKP